MLKSSDCSDLSVSVSLSTHLLSRDLSRAASMSTPTTLLHLLILILAASLAAGQGQTGIFTCRSTANCQSLIDYISPNATTLSAIQSLFGMSNHRTLLGANNFPPSTSPNTSVSKGQRLHIPFPCSCSNGTGHSRGLPIYTVQPDDGLSHIAEDVFAKLVTVQQIADANNIPNVNLIQLGQELYIPLPCSCDDVDGSKVVHYGHMVESGTSLEIIAANYGTTESTLMTLNGISNPKDLLADVVLDVPLKACSSSIGSDSLDSPLLVSNGTYVYTANNCVRCNCQAANNYTLQCKASGISVNGSGWATCPSMQCQAASRSLSLGEELMSSASACNQTCAYAGFTNQTILTALVPDSTCAASPDGNAPSSAPPAISSQLIKSFLLAAFAALCLFLLQ
uniref:LysM domain-containing protein n=1 Tax=Kalanchoe fedtschenkoi TaxID=63787 RepID=A0A7N0UWG7_KALFE